MWTSHVVASKVDCSHRFILFELIESLDQFELKVCQFPVGEHQADEAFEAFLRVAKRQEYFDLGRSSWPC